MRRTDRPSGCATRIAWWVRFPSRTTPSRRWLEGCSSLEEAPSTRAPARCAGRESIQLAHGPGYGAWSPVRRANRWHGPAHALCARRREWRGALETRGVGPDCAAGRGSVARSATFWLNPLTLARGARRKAARTDRAQAPVHTQSLISGMSSRCSREYATALAISASHSPIKPDARWRNRGARRNASIQR